MSTVHDWYTKEIAIFTQFAQEAARDSADAQRIRNNMPTDFTRMVMLQIVEMAEERQRYWNSMVASMQDMYDREEAWAEAEALMENYPVPDDYDPHPCAEQMYLDRTIVDNYPCYSYQCGKCGGSHYELVQHSYYHG